MHFPLHDDVFIELQYINVLLLNYKYIVNATLPHFVPEMTGQPACLVLKSPSPDLIKLCQNTTSPYTKQPINYKYG